MAIHGTCHEGIDIPSKNSECTNAMDQQPKGSKIDTVQFLRNPLRTTGGVKIHDSTPSGGGPEWMGTTALYPAST
jgi:hypothetical protein